MRTFRQFAMQQVARCESLPSGPGYIFSENAQVEIRNWLEARSDIPPTATRQSERQWLEESQAAR